MNINQRNERTTITAIFICDVITKKYKKSENDFLHIKKHDTYLFASRIRVSIRSESRFEILGAINNLFAFKSALRDKYD